MALFDEGEINLYKKQGKVSNLVEFATDKNKNGHLGIGHTRWATHGEPNDSNSHPHLSNNGNLVMIHNGIIENYASIKSELEKRGYIFHSDTDTEVLLNLIEDIRENEKLSLGAALRKALNHVIGAYAIALIDKNEPSKLYAARKSSPLVVGIGENEYFIASDASPIIEYTKNVMYLEDEEIAILEPGKEINLFTIQNKEKTPYIQELEIQLEAIEKGGYDHFMLKEIYEQPEAILNTIDGRVGGEDVLDNILKSFLNADRIIIIACGTSWHAGLVGEYLFEEIARIPVEVEYATEFRYRNPVIYEGDIVIAISQSGETADTLAAIELAKSKGATILGVCNVVGSSISRETDAGAYTHAGPEIGVASTKAFTAQITVLTLMALSIGHKKGTVPVSRYQSLLSGIRNDS